MDKEIEHIKNCTTEQEIQDLGWNKKLILYKIRKVNDPKEVDQYMYFSPNSKHTALFFAKPNNKVKFDKAWEFENKY